MRNGSTIYRFGPFELDSGHRRLRRGRDPVWLPDRHMDVLLVLAAHAGRVVSKDTLTEAAWRGLAVTDNSLVQAIKGVRKALGSQADGAPYIETLVRQGYRFMAPVDSGRTRQPDAALDALLEPYRAFVDGRAALETLDRAAVNRARDTFEDALRVEPDLPAAHIGMANACVLHFESTRADAAPDRPALRQAEHHAREGCRLDPSSGDAWSTLAFVQHRIGRGREAIAAARKAVRLEPDDWRHHVRLGFVSWGEERLRAAHRMLALCPGLALGYWLAATVFVARQAYDPAMEALRAGCASQDAQPQATGRFTAVGLHLLHGLVLAARGASDAAFAALGREIEFETLGHVYARECGANAWYTLGALHLREGRRDDAQAAFHEARARVPGHALAAVGLAAMSPSSHSAWRHHGGTGLDGAILHSAVLTLEGKHHEAARLCGEALTQADPGSGGWLLPVEPLLHATAHREAWAQTLATLRDRAM